MSVQLLDARKERHAMITPQQAREARDTISTAIESGREVSEAYLMLDRFIAEAENDAENTRMAMFGRGVVGILDGREWNADCWQQISFLAEALNVPLAPPQDEEPDDDEDEANS